AAPHCRTGRVLHLRRHQARPGRREPSLARLQGAPRRALVDRRIRVTSATTSRRVGHAVVTLLAASVLTWSLLLLAPGDPARRVLAANNVVDPRPEQVAAMRDRLGLDGNPLERYASWLGHAVRGDFGTSWTTGRSVGHELLSRLPATLVLTAA